MALSRLQFLYFVVCKQKTAYEMRISDWSSDVCSSDLLKSLFNGSILSWHAGSRGSSCRLCPSRLICRSLLYLGLLGVSRSLLWPSLGRSTRSEARRVGIERVSTCRYWWWPSH